MKQQTLTGFEKYGKTTRRAQLLSDMDRMLPWPALIAVVEPAALSRICIAWRSPRRSPTSISSGAACCLRRRGVSVERETRRIGAKSANSIRLRTFIGVLQTFLNDIGAVVSTDSAPIDYQCRVFSDLRELDCVMVSGHQGAVKFRQHLDRQCRAGQIELTLAHARETGEPPAISIA